MPEPSVPIACTLPPDQVDGRLAEFHELFAAHLVRVERPAPTRLRLVLGGAAGEHAVRALLDRERQCCAFLDVTVTAEGGQLLADLEVPAAGAPALDGLAGIAWWAAPAAAP
ncbi:MAG TPA: hypothetical protein VF486_27300 [Actinomycetes bacterium]